MTREEAIAFFKDMNECTYGNLEALEMAIEALKAQPCEDAVRRETVRDMVCEIHCRNERSKCALRNICKYMNRVSALPPVTPAISEEAAAAVCDHYCRFPREYDEDLHGIPLAESEICKNCPLTLAAERENTE